MSAIDKIAESYRVRLGLRTWREQETWARDRCAKAFAATGIRSDRDRRSGRTTRAMLEKIAIAVHTGAGVILIQSRRKETFLHCAWVANDLMHLLDINGIQVARWSGHRAMTKHVVYVVYVVYVDHHDADAVSRAVRT